MNQLSTYFSCSVSCFILVFYDLVDLWRARDLVSARAGGCNLARTWRRMSARALSAPMVGSGRLASKSPPGTRMATQNTHSRYSFVTGFAGVRKVPWQKNRGMKISNMKISISCMKIKKLPKSFHDENSMHAIV